MTRCCSTGAYREFFDEKLARKDAERYREKGLERVSRRLVELVAQRGIDGASVLEIGGGTGTVQIELLERGANRATNVELSPAYDAEARKLLDEHGLAGRVDRRVTDLVTEPDVVSPADVVLLNRVVCCYPDSAALLAMAAGKARRLVAFTFPPNVAIARVGIRVVNLWLRLRRCDFRTYVHSERAMLDTVEHAGFRVVTRENAGIWRVAVLEREAAAA